MLLMRLAQILPENLCVRFLFGNNHFPMFILFSDENNRNRVPFFGNFGKFFYGNFAFRFITDVDEYLILSYLDHMTLNHLPFFELLKIF